MPAMAASWGRPSTLADVIGQVIDAFDLMGDATTIQVGEQYVAELGVGAPPKVVFVPDPNGKAGPPIEMANVCSIEHGCDVYVRAVEGEGAGQEVDVQRFQNAYTLADLVMACLAVAATGRITWGAYNDSSPTQVNAFGAELTFSFSYRRDVRANPSRWALPQATADSASQDLRPPPPNIEDATGPYESGTVYSVAVTTTPEEPEEED